MDIIGIVFELDKTTYEDRLKKGVSSNRASKQATQSIMVFHQDPNNNEYIDIRSYADGAKETKINETLKKAFQNSLSPKEVASYYSGDPRVIDSIDRAKNHKEYLSVETRNEVTKKTISKVSKGKIAGVTAAIALVGVLAACGNNKKETEEELPTIETQVEVQNNIKVQLEFKDWADYFTNAEQTDQKNFFVNGIAEWVNTTNASENWEKLTLTEEEMKTYGYTSLECIFGFTAEDAYSLALRYNQYSKEQLVTLTGGKEMDVESLINSPDSISNTALTKIQTYYFNSEECDLNIEKLLTFTEQGQNKIDELEGLFKEYKILEKDAKKEDEAKEKMAEIKHVLLECAYDTTFDEDAKSYILSTFLPTASRISEMHQYKDTVEIELYDKKNDKQVTKEIKTALFDEITNRALRLGFSATENVGSFDSKSFLENHNIDASRYNLLNVDVERSISDQLCGAQAEKLKEANEYIANLRSEDSVMEVAYAGVQGIDLSINGVSADSLDNVVSTYDKLTKGTNDPMVIMELIDNDLKSKDMYPQNVEYFNTTLVSKKIEEYKNTHGITSGKPGDITKGQTKNVSATSSQLNSGVVYNHAGQVVSAEEAMEEAREQNEQETGIYDASTPEAEKEAEQKAEKSDGYAQRQALLQNVYNATYNYFYGQNELPTTSGYDANWATSSDAEIVNRHNTAKSQAESRKAQEAAAAKENEKQKNQQPNIDPKFDDAEISQTPQDPVESINNKTPETPATPANPTPTQPNPSEENNNSGINYFPGFEDAEIEGNIVIGDSAPTATSLESSTEGFSSEAPAGFSSVVDSSTVPAEDTSYIFTEEEILNYVNSLSDEEFNSWDGTISMEDSTDDVKTK